MGCFFFRCLFLQLELFCHCFFTCRLTVRVFQKKWLLGNTGSMKSPSSCTSLEKKSWNSDNYSCEGLNLILINKHMSSCLTHVIFTSMLSCHFSTLRRKVSPKKFLQLANRERSLGSILGRKLEAQE